MTTPTSWTPVDRFVTTPLPDFTAARATEIPRQFQHAMMSGYGGAPQARGFYVAAQSGSAVTRNISVRATPGIKEVDIEILANGNGTILFTTSTDTTGTGFRIRTAPGNNGPALELARWSRTGGSGDPTDDAGRALILRSSVAWTFDWVATTVVVTPDTGADLTVYALVFHPIHVPR